MDVTGQGEEIFRPIHHKTLESSLKQMPMTPMTAIEIHCIGRQEATHHFRKARLLCSLYEKMKMCGYKAPDMNTKFKKRGIFDKIRKKFIAIPGILKNTISGIGPGQYMIERKRQIDSKRSSHDV